MKKKINILSIPMRALTLYRKNKLHFFSMENAEKLSQAFIALTIVIIVHWFSGPYAAVATRALYEVLFNQYAWYDPRYYLFHVPAREHISYQAFIYGPYAISVLLIPLIYQLTRQAASWGKKLFKYFFNRENKLDHPLALEEIHTEELNAMLNHNPSDHLFTLNPNQHTPVPPVLHYHSHLTTHHHPEPNRCQIVEPHEIEITPTPKFSTTHLSQ